MNILPQWVKRNSSVSHDTDATAFAEDHGTSQVHEAEMSPEPDAFEAADAMAPAPAEAPQATDVHDAPARPARSAWDLADDGTTPYIGVPQAQTQSRPVIEFPAAEPAETAAPAPAAGIQQKPNATRTRLIGFDKSDGSSVDLFDKPAAKAEGRSIFPVGWIIVVDGPGRGHAFTLHSGLSPIGRNDDQAIALNFGDTAISRHNHAAIVFDSETDGFMIGHGGKSNIVRLNGKPVIANEDLADGDIITIGETALRLRTFCGADFTWEDRAPEAADVLSVV